MVELIHTNSPAFSQATIRGVLDTLGVVLKNYLPMGHTMKIDNLGVFSLALEFADEKAENVAQQEIKGDESKTKYHHVKVKGVNFKVDKKLIKAINKENTFERTSSNVVSRSPYTPEERQQRALQHIDKHGFITLQDYANLNRLRQPQPPQSQRSLARALQTNLFSHLPHRLQRRRLPQILGAKKVSME